MMFFGGRNQQDDEDESCCTALGTRGAIQTLYIPQVIRTMIMFCGIFVFPLVVIMQRSVMNISLYKFITLSCIILRISD